MRALLTGAGGFCGRHLAHYLRDKDVEVYSMSVNAKRCDTEIRIESTTDVQGMCHALSEVSPDFVFHLAGTMHTESSVGLYKTNTLYAVSLLEAMGRLDLTSVPVLMVGTAAELGFVEASDLPLGENHLPMPVSHYGASKLAQTQVGLTAARMGWPVVVARPFNIIGPGVSKQLVAGRIIDQIFRVPAQSGRVHVALGNIDSTRDFIDVEDVVASYWDLIQTSDAYGKVVNICTGQETSVRELIEHISRLTGLQLVVDEIESQKRINDIPRHVGSNRLLQELTGRQPVLDLTRTLQRTLDQAKVPQ